MNNKQLHIIRESCRYQLMDKKKGPVEEVNKFLEALEARGLSSFTIRAYAFDLLVLYRWLKEYKKRLTELKQPDLLKFISAQKKVGINPNTINRRLVSCRILYRFHTNQEIGMSSGSSLPANHYKGRGRDRYLGIHQMSKSYKRMLSVKTPRTIVEPLTKEQVGVFLRSLKRYRDLCIVYLMLFCGLRSREVLSLRLKDISFEENLLRVCGKGNKDRIIPLAHIVLQVLQDYIRLERPSDTDKGIAFVVLQGKRRGQPMTYAGLRSLFRHRRLNKTIASANPHRFRHTFGTDMARSGIDLPILQKLMGHESSVMTLQYIDLSMADIAKEYNKAIEQIQKRYENQ